MQYRYILCKDKFKIRKLQINMDLISCKRLRNNQLTNNWLIKKQF